MKKVIRAILMGSLWLGLLAACGVIVGHLEEGRAA